MILVDYRKGSKELASIITRIGVPCEETTLPYGDFCFEGNGPEGTVTIGVERKTLHDLLHCIDDARYVVQKDGMKRMYKVSYLALEGSWKAHDQTGHLMEEFVRRDGMRTWGYCQYRSRPVMYHKLYRYLISACLSGVIVTQSRDMFGTAFNLCEMYHYYQKRWTDHTSMIETQKLAIPQLSGPPSLTRLWAAQVDGLGVKFSSDAERIFKTPYRLATSVETDWLRIRGIGVPTAQSIVRQIQGGKA